MSGARVPLRFEIDKGGERRFWTILDLGGNRCDITFGIVGGSPRSVTRTIDGSIDAMIAKQLAQGYVEVSEPDAVIATIVPGRHWTRHFLRGDRRIELTLAGDRVIQRVDKDPPQVSAHPSAAVARADVMQRIRAYTADGYVVREVTSAATTGDEPVAYAHHAELLAACRAAPRDPAAAAVYRDWLIGQGDVRGELAAHVEAGAYDEASTLFARHRAALIGNSPVEILHWRHGFPQEALICRRDDDDLAALARDFAARPYAELVDSLKLGLAADRHNDWGPAIAAIGASPLGAYLRDLRFDADGTMLSSVPFGDFSSAWRQLPRLETLVIDSGAGGTLGEIDLPELRHFARISGGLARSELASIATARWPKLEHLEIWTGSADYGANTTVLDVLPILAGDRLPTVRHLGIVNSELVDELIEPLARSALLTRLRTLDLSMGIMAHTGARRLVEHAAAFRHLDLIDLGENHLAPSDLARIRAVLPRVIAERQRERYEEDEDDEDYGRYVAVGE